MASTKKLYLKTTEERRALVRLFCKINGNSAKDAANHVNVKPNVFINYKNDINNKLIPYEVMKLMTEICAKEVGEDAIKKETGTSSLDDLLDKPATKGVYDFRDLKYFKKAPLLPILDLYRNKLREKKVSYRQAVVIVGYKGATKTFREIFTNKNSDVSSSAVTGIIKSLLYDFGYSKKELAALCNAKQLGNALVVSREFEVVDDKLIQLLNDGLPYYGSITKMAESAGCDNTTLGKALKGEYNRINKNYVDALRESIPKCRENEISNFMSRYGIIIKR